MQAPRGNTNLCAATGVFEGGDGSGTRCAGIAYDIDHISTGFGDTYRNGTDAFGACQFDDEPDTRGFGVMDQLAQILDRISIVVRRRIDQLHTRCPTARGGDFNRDFARR